MPRFDRSPPSPGLSAAAGFHAFAGGIGFILSTPSVWLYALVPMAMMLVLLVLFSGLGIWEALHLHRVLFDDSASTVGQVGGWLLTGLLVLLSLLVAAVLALTFARPMSGPALEKIVLAQEQSLTGTRSEPPPFLGSVARTVSVSLVTLGVSVPLLGGLFLVNLVFPPALVVTLPLKFLICAWLLAWDFLDYPLGLQGLGLGQRLRWAARNFNALTSFGIAWAALIVIPGIVLVLLPMGAAGATRLAVAARGGPDEIADRG